jgi:hypothetical protein
VHPHQICGGHFFFSRHKGIACCSIKQQKSLLLFYLQCFSIKASTAGVLSHGNIVPTLPNKKRLPHYLNNLLLLASSRTCICCIAILFNFTKRSGCGIPSSIKTAFRFSMFDKQISSFIVA